MHPLTRLAITTAACAASALSDVAHLADAVCGPVRVNPSSLAFTDKCGRARFFRGLNVVFKSYPWAPDTTPGAFDPTQSFSDVDARLCASLGFTAMRVGFMWPGVAPLAPPADFNSSYVAVVSNLTATMASVGISALIDMHQDIISGTFCGEGIPDWAATRYAANAQPFPVPVESTPYVVNASTGEPSPADCGKHPGWSDYYFSDALCKAVGAMYSNTNGSAEDFYDFWAAGGAAFADPRVAPAVIGFEVMNEPWAGDVLSNPLLMIPGVADATQLQPFFTNATAAIRAGEASVNASDHHVVFWETVTWDDFIPAGFTAMPGAAAGLAALSYHYYSLPNFDYNWQLDARGKDMRRLGVGGLLTEFDFGSSSNLSDIIDTMAACDAHQQGYIGWEYKSFVPITGANNGFFNADGSLQLDKVTAAARTYPLAVAGNVSSYSFDNNTRIFTLAYSVNPNATAPTVVFISDALVYPTNYTIAVTTVPADSATWTLQHFAAEAGVTPPGAPAPFPYSYLFVTAAANATAATTVLVTVAPQ